MYKKRKTSQQGFTFADSLHDIELGQIIDKDKLIGKKQQQEVEEALQLCELYSNLFLFPFLVLFHVV